jgi:hypothetical protein
MNSYGSIKKEKHYDRSQYYYTIKNKKILNKIRKKYNMSNIIIDRVYLLFFSQVDRLNNYDYKDPEKDLLFHIEFVLKPLEAYDQIAKLIESKTNSSDTARGCYFFAGTMKCPSQKQNKIGVGIKVDDNLRRSDSIYDDVLFGTLKLKESWKDRMILSLNYASYIDKGKKIAKGREEKRNEEKWEKERIEQEKRKILEEKRLNKKYGGITM